MGHATNGNWVALDNSIAEISKAIKQLQDTVAKLTPSPAPTPPTPTPAPKPLASKKI